MSTCDFRVEIDCGEKHSTLFFRFSKVEGGAPVLCGVDTEHNEFTCHVVKTVKAPKITRNELIERVEYRKRKREIFYEEAEGDSTEYTYDD